MSTYLLQGLALGFGSGISPGPFLAVVLSASLRGGFKHGAAVAMSPLVTDLPIVLLCLTVLSQLPGRAIAMLSLAGAAVLAWYAYEAVRDARTVSLVQLRERSAHVTSARHALRRGVITNFLNPSPWMFWISIGGPLLTTAWADAPINVPMFVVPFYALLIGSKMAIAWAASAGRSRFSDAGYRYTLYGAATLLIGLALSLGHTGLVALGG